MKMRYENGRSLLHKLNPLTKLLVLILYSISIFLFDSLFIELACLLLILVIIWAIGSRSLWSFLRSRYLVSFSLLIFIIQVIFTRDGETLLSIPMYFFSIDITLTGILIGLIVTFRFLTIILASAIFVVTTDPNELAYSLMQAGLPYRFGFMLVTAMRFIPVFESEANTVRCAQRARGLGIDEGDIKGVMRSVKFTLMPLIVSALSKVDVLVISMEGRAFGYKLSRTFTRKSRFSMLDIAIVIIALLIFSLLMVDIWYGLVELPEIDIYNN